MKTRLVMLAAAMLKATASPLYAAGHMQCPAFPCSTPAGNAGHTAPRVSLLHSLSGLSGKGVQLPPGDAENEETNDHRVRRVHRIVAEAKDPW